MHFTFGTWSRTLIIEITVSTDSTSVRSQISTLVRKYWPNGIRWVQCGRYRPVVPSGDMLDTTGAPTNPADLNDERRAQLPRVNILASSDRKQPEYPVMPRYVAPPSQLAGRVHPS